MQTKEERRIYKRDWKRKQAAKNRLSCGASIPKVKELVEVEYEAGNDAWKALTKLEAEWRAARKVCRYCGDRHVLIQ